MFARVVNHYIPTLRQEFKDFGKVYVYTFIGGSAGFAYGVNGKIKKQEKIKEPMDFEFISKSILHVGTFTFLGGSIGFITAFSWVSGMSCLATCGMTSYCFDEVMSYFVDKKKDDVSR